MNFSKWLKSYTSFSTQKQYNDFIGRLSYNDRKLVSEYYETKYKYFLLTQKNNKKYYQLEFNL